LASVFYFKTIVVVIFVFKTIHEAVMVIKFSGVPTLKTHTAKARTVRRQAETTEVPLIKVTEKRRRGRPASGKETVTLRVNAEAVAYFKSLGDDWKSMMSDVLHAQLKP
jgi:uncharacterized protein (DUF4415 family)